MGGDDPHHGSTPIIGQRELTVEGVSFEWWVVGEDPALVTVRTPTLGSLSEFARGDVAAYAHSLAKRLLFQQRAHSASAQQRNRSRPVLNKPGWFQADDIDFGATHF